MDALVRMTQLGQPLCTQPLMPRHVGLDLFLGLEASQMREEKLMSLLWPSPRDVTCDC